MLQSVKLERCNIYYFEPKKLANSVKQLSLAQNKIEEINSIKFGYKENNYDLEEINLLTLDLSSNLFKEFPYNSISEPPVPNNSGEEAKLTLCKLDLSRNRIQNIDPGLDFKKFECLTQLDLSSNLLTEFPIALK